MRDETNEHQAFALPGARPQFGPDKAVAVEHIDLHLTPNFADESLDGVCTMTVRALDEAVPRLYRSTPWTWRFRASSGSRATAKRRELKFAPRQGELEIEFEPPIAAQESVTFAVRYRVVKPRHGLFFVKPTADHPEKIAHAWTQSQDQYARYWFPCLDYPHEKQPTSTTIVVPKGMFALGNGELIERRDEDDRTIFRYREDVPHSTYLMTMVAGPFAEVASGTAGRNGVPIYYYVLPGRESEGERSFGATPQDAGALRAAHRNAVSVRALFADRGDRLHLRRDGEHLGDHADRPDAPRRDGARGFLERSAGRARARASVVRRPVDVPRLGARVAQRRLRDVHGGRVARSRPRLRRVSLRYLRMPNRIPARGFGSLSAADRLQHLSRPHRDLRSPPLPKRRRGAAHAARRARRVALLARHRTVRAGQRATQRRDDRPGARDRGRDRPKPARFLQPVGVPREAIPSSRSARPGTPSATSPRSRSIRSNRSMRSIRPTSSTSRSASRLQS